MKKILYIVAAVIALGAVAACTDDDNNKTTWEQYADWRQTNITWLEQQQARTNPDGTPYYEVVTPSWYSGAYVLMHRFGESNKNNLRPLSTSTIDVIYQGFNCEGERNHLPLQHGLRRELRKQPHSALLGPALQRAPRRRVRLREELILHALQSSQIIANFASAARMVEW